MENANQNTSDGQCRFTIKPIQGMEGMQKNFAAYGQDGDRAAEDFIQAKKLTLARRFQLIERGYTLELKEGICRKSMFDEVDVRITLPNYGKNREQEKLAAKEDKENEGSV